MMLQRMVIEQAQRRGNSGPKDKLPPADFVVSSDAEWDAVFAASASDLSGKIVQVRGSAFTQRRIADRDMKALGAPLTIRSADDASSLPSLLLDGTVRGVDFSGLHFRMTGWPKSYGSCVVFNNGTFGALRFDTASFAHGYGEALAPIDTAAQLPEYDRIDNVHTATTASATHPLVWKDAAAPGGWIEFFNRGSEPVHVAIGGSNVGASPSDPQIAPGGRLRLTKLVPQTDTHIAVLAASGISEVNARTEIGLAQYLASAFASSGAADIEDIELRGCRFADLSNAVKGIASPDRIVVMDCAFERIYQDIVAVAPKPGGSARILRNLDCLPFARSGIAEGLQGDAGDPHGDGFQMFSDGAGTIGDVIYAGNRTRIDPLRDGVTSQGVFVSDNDVSPSYEQLFLISTMQVGGAPNGIAIGEAGYPVREAMIYGASVVAHRDAGDVTPQVALVCKEGGQVYCGSVVAPNIVASAGSFVGENLVLASEAATPSDLFPDLADLSTARDRGAIEAAVTSAGEATGLGASATADAIDWETDDPERAVLWDRVPSGVHWNAQDGLDTGAMVELPPRKVLNRLPSQAVVPGASTQWRKLASDGASVLFDWTDQPGTVEPGEYVQIRHAASSDALATVIASVAINGFTQDVELTTKAGEPTEYLSVGANAGYFVDSANVPAGTRRITFQGAFRYASIVQAMKLFTQESTGCDFVVQADGSVKAGIEDGTGFAVVSNGEIAPAGSIRSDRWQLVSFDVDHTAREVRVVIDGVETVTPFASPGNGVFQSTREVSFLGSTGGANLMPVGTLVADLSVRFEGILHKAIPNDPALANADPWKRGGDFGGAV